MVVKWVGCDLPGAYNERCIYGICYLFVTVTVGVLVVFIHAEFEF